jgi:hypothetical protein
MKIMKINVSNSDFGSNKYWDEVYDLMDNEHKSEWIVGENRNTEENWSPGCEVVVVQTDGVLHTYVVEVPEMIMDVPYGEIVPGVVNIGLDTHADPKLVWASAI